MSTKAIKKMLLGEKMPDKDDPQYKERYERDVKAGRKFAKTLRIDKFAAKVQGFANHHTTAFLVIVFGFVISSFGWNLYRLAYIYNHKPSQRTATEMQDSLVRAKHKNIGNIERTDYEHARNQTEN